MSRPDPAPAARPATAKPGSGRPVVVTGNALIDGWVVWLDANDALIRDLAGAQVFTDAAQAQAALARTTTRQAEVVGCYLADVCLTPDGPRPTHFREGYRRDGPSAAARIPARIDP